MKADRSSLRAHLAGRVSIHKKIVTKILLDATEDLECTQAFVKRKVLFAELVDSAIEQELKPPVIPILTMRDDLRALPLAKQIISTRVSSD